MSRGADRVEHADHRQRDAVDGDGLADRVDRR